MDLVSVTENSETFRNQLRRKNKQLAKYNTLYEESNDSVCMYFHDPSFYTEEKIHQGISKLREYGIEIVIRKVWILLNDGNDMISLMI